MAGSKPAVVMYDVAPGRDGRLPCDVAGKRRTIDVATISLVAVPAALSRERMASQRVAWSPPLHVQVPPTPSFVISVSPPMACPRAGVETTTGKGAMASAAPVDAPTSHGKRRLGADTLSTAIRMVVRRLFSPVAVPGCVRSHGWLDRWLGCSFHLCFPHASAAGH